MTIPYFTPKADYMREKKICSLSTPNALSFNKHMMIIFDRLKTAQPMFFEKINSVGFGISDDYDSVKPKICISGEYDSVFIGFSKRFIKNVRLNPSLYASRIADAVAYVFIRHERSSSVSKEEADFNRSCIALKMLHSAGFKLSDYLDDFRTSLSAEHFSKCKEMAGVFENIAVPVQRKNPFLFANHRKIPLYDYWADADISGDFCGRDCLDSYGIHQSRFIWNCKPKFPNEVPEFMQLMNRTMHDDEMELIVNDLHSSGFKIFPSSCYKIITGGNARDEGSLGAMYPLQRLIFMADPALFSLRSDYVLRHELFHAKRANELLRDGKLSQAFQDCDVEKCIEMERDDDALAFASLHRVRVHYPKGYLGALLDQVNGEANVAFYDRERIERDPYRWAQERFIAEKSYLAYGIAEDQVKHASGFLMTEEFSDLLSKPPSSRLEIFEKIQSFDPRFGVLRQIYERRLALLKESISR